MIDVFSYQVITQAIGIVASGFVVFSFSQKRDNNLKIYLIIGNLLFAIHFFMLGAFAGMCVNIINIMRVGCSIKFHKSNKVMFVFFLIYSLVAALIYEKPYDLLPIFSSFLGTYSMFKLSGIKLRLLGLLGSSAWLTYGIIFQSIGGIITEVTGIILNLTTVYRLQRDNKKGQT